MNRILKIAVSVITAIIQVAVLAAGQGTTNQLAELAPPAIPGLERSDSDHATIYANDEQALALAKSLVNDAANDFTGMTAEKIQKGIVITITPGNKHPLLRVMELLEAADSNTTRQVPQNLLSILASSKTNSLPAGLKLNDVLQMVPIILPAAFIQVLALDGQTNLNRQDVSHSLEMIMQTTGQPPRSAANPWILCLPSPQSNKYVSEEILPRLMRAELGLVKYMLVKPFMGKIRTEYSEELSHVAKIELFSAWLDGVNGFDEEKKKRLKKEYADRFTKNNT